MKNIMRKEMSLVVTKMLPQSACALFSECVNWFYEQKSDDGVCRR